VPAVGRRAEIAKVEIVDPHCGDAGGELPLGEARPAGGCNRAHVDEESHAGGGKGPDHRIRGRFLVADGEDCRHGG
jgi:hypothetical protein